MRNEKCYVVVIIIFFYYYMIFGVIYQAIMTYEMSYHLKNINIYIEN